MNPSAGLGGGAVALILVFGFIAGVYVDQAYPEFVPYFGHRGVSRVDLSEVQQAARLIQADYVDGNVNGTKLSQGSVQALVSSLGDPFSLYFSPDQYNLLQATYQGRYTGIAVYLSSSPSASPRPPPPLPWSPP